MKKAVANATAFLLSAACAAVTAKGEEDNKCDDNEPDYLVLEKLAEAVHIYVLSFHFFLGIGDFTLQYNNM